MEGVESGFIRTLPEDLFFGAKRASSGCRETSAFLFFLRWLVEERLSPEVQALAQATQGNILCVFDNRLGFNAATGE